MSPRGTDDVLTGALLRTRTTPPRPSARTLTRPRLHERLDLGAAHLATVVSGSPGSGKTQLVSDWVHAGARPVAWVALEEDCNDPHLLWSLVLTALQRTAPATPALKALRPPLQVEPEFLDRLLRAISDLREPVTLVLEDVHELHTAEVLSGLDLVLGSMPATLHLLLVTRSDPPLALHRLRLAGEVTEVRQSALAFTDEEAGALFDQHGLRLTPAELAMVMDRTEGWTAGVRLAALALEGCHDPEDRGAAIAAFAGDNRAVADYLMAEALDAQPAWLRDFLLRTSVVERIDASLADALVGGARGAEALDRLERSGALIVALDEPRGWFRYHRLFLEVCRHRLAVEAQGEVRDLHGRAALWFAANGEPLEAVRHAVAADDPAAAARAAVCHAGPLLLGHAGRAARSLLRSLPEDDAPHDLWLACARALAWYDEGDDAELDRRISSAQALVEHADPRTRTAPAMVLALLRGARLRAEYDVVAAGHEVTRALELAESVSRGEVPALGRYVAFGHLLLGTSLVWQGRVVEAERHLRTARRASYPVPGVAEVDETLVLSRAHLSMVLGMSGRLEDARAEAEAALALVAAAGWTDGVQSTAAHLALVLVHLQRADRESCERELARAARVLEQKPDRLLDISRHLAKVRLLALDGRHDAATASLERAAVLVAELPDVGFLSAWLDIVALENDLAAGRHEALLRRVPAAGAGGPLATYARIARARALLSLGRAEEALVEVRPVTSEAAAGLQGVPAWLITAEAQEAQRRDGAALVALSHALELAAPERVLRPFLLVLDRIEGLLERHRTTVGSHTDLVDVLLGLPTQRRPLLTDPLTDRELAVLQLLPSMMSNLEIAEELFVSVNTVKAHLKSLYRKLGAVSRRDAVLRSGLQLTASAGQGRVGESDSRA